MRDLPLHSSGTIFSPCMLLKINLFKAHRVSRVKFIIFVFPASVARHLYIRAPCGVGALTKVYGGEFL